MELILILLLQRRAARKRVTIGYYILTNGYSQLFGGVLLSFSSSRLKAIRESLGINKAEAARRMHMTAMGYGRYEGGERVPSFQSIQYMALHLGTSSAYLFCETDDPSPDQVLISQDKNPVLFELTVELSKEDSYMQQRMLAYYRKLKEDLLSE